MDKSPRRSLQPTPSRAAPAASTALTPFGELDEADIHAVLGYQLAQATIAAAQVFANTVTEPHDLRPVEYTVLHLIAVNPGASPGRIASALSLTKSNVTLWLDRLEARKLVERRPSPTDGRSWELVATATGSTLAARCTQALLEAERRAFEALSTAERAMLAELLHKLSKQR